MKAFGLAIFGLRVFAFSTLALVIAGCATRATKSAETRANKPTLGNSDFLPKDAIAHVINSPAQWSELRDAPYEGFVVLSGNVREDGLVKINKITRRYPDASRDAMAWALVQNIHIQAASTGSSIQPGAEVYVIFLGERREGQLAVVFAQQMGSYMPRNYEDGRYLNIVTF